MRVSSARLLNSSVRIADLTFPASGVMLPRTRAIFVHLENLLSFAKRDRDGRVDGYLTGYLPEEDVVLFFRQGEVINAATIGPGGRAVVPISEALRRLKSDPERSEFCYAAATAEQLNWMFSACAASTELRFVDPRAPEQIFPVLAGESFTGVLELISQGRVNYLKFESGRFIRGYLCDRPATSSVVRYMESLFELRPDGAHPAIAGSVSQEGRDIPVQAPVVQVKAYREMIQRICLAVEQELPDEGRRKGERASVAIASSHPAFSVLAGTAIDEEPAIPVPAEALTQSFAEWTTRFLQEVEIVSPGTAERVIRNATREQRFVLQAAGFYDQIPWRINW
ncbi:MAG: hypothetical protein ABI613_04565 [Gemmatimonadota bacterium]